MHPIDIVFICSLCKFHFCNSHRKRLRDLKKLQNKSVIPKNQPHKENGKENEKITEDNKLARSISHMLCKFQKDRSRNKKVKFIARRFHRQRVNVISQKTGECYYYYFFRSILVINIEMYNYKRFGEHSFTFPWKIMTL